MAPSLRTSSHSMVPSTLASGPNSSRPVPRSVPMTVPSMRVAPLHGDLSLEDTIRRNQRRIGVLPRNDVLQGFCLCFRVVRSVPFPFRPDVSPRSSCLPEQEPTDPLEVLEIEVFDFEPAFAIGARMQGHVGLQAPFDAVDEGARIGSIDAAAFGAAGARWREPTPACSRAAFSVARTESPWARIWRCSASRCSTSETCSKAFAWPILILPASTSPWIDRLRSSNRM